MKSQRLLLVSIDKIGGSPQRQLRQAFIQIWLLFKDLRYLPLILFGHELSTVIVSVVNLNSPLMSAALWLLAVFINCCVELTSGPYPARGM